jgi:opacity protein-like surface antigen
LRLQISPRVTARLLGFLVNPSLLLYGTGGVAYGRVEQSVPGASVKTRA